MNAGGGGDGMSGGKGTGGSGNNGWDFDGFGSEDGFFIAGTGSWVLIGAAFCLCVSLFSQIFRGKGSPASRNKKGKTNAQTTNSSTDPEIHNAGSLSHASNRTAFRGYSNPSSKLGGQNSISNFFRESGFFNDVVESAKIHFRGLFTGTLYPSHKIRSQAFYRGFIGLVGPKPGDWVETVGTSTDDNDKTLSFGHQRNRSLDGIFVLREEKVEEPTQSTNPHDLNLLMDELNHIQQQLKRSEARRKELLDDLASTNVRNEEREVALRKQIESQESLNRKIRERLNQIQEERNSLMNVLGEAKGTVEGVLPNVTETIHQMDGLTREVKTHKTNLRLMEKQLTVTSRERDAVLQRMEALQRDVNDIESLLDIVEKSRDLVSQTENEDYSDKILKANSCIQVLQQYLLKPTGGRHLSPIREVGNRVVIVFEKLMVELKRGFMQASKYIKQLETIQGRLTESSHDETILSSQLEELKMQYDRLEELRASSEATLKETEHSLATVQENLDRSSIMEASLRAAMEELTSEKDMLSEKMRSIRGEMADIESLMDIMGKARGLILNMAPNAMGLEQISSLDECMKILQQHHPRPTENASTDISVRLIKVFEDWLTQTKTSITKVIELKGNLKKVEEDLEKALSEENSLSLTIEGLRSQLNDLNSARVSLSNDVRLLKNELDEKTISLDQLRMELSSLDDVREEQAKDIEKLREELSEKKRLLEASKQNEIDMAEALEKIGEERDLLQSKLQMNEEDLNQLKESLDEVLAEGKHYQEELDAVQAEKSNLKTQLSGLTHRIKDFEVENDRLNNVARTLRSNLDHERREKEQLENEAEELMTSRKDMHEKFLEQVESLKGRLENAQGECDKLKETCDTLEESKQRLEVRLEEECTKYNEHMEELKKRYEQDIPLNGSIQSDPHQSQNQTSPFDLDDAIPIPGLGEGAPAQTAEEMSQGPLPECEETYRQPTESKVQTWLDEADVDPCGVMPTGRDLSTAPLYETDSNTFLGNLMHSGPIGERRIHRRLSWPQDMTFALNDNLLGAAQELVEMTTATLELAAEKNALEVELNEVRQYINEARAQLEEKENEVSDLTEHFLQVYQIASEMTAENEEQSEELRQLRISYERQKQEIETKDARIAMLESEFALQNRAPPRGPFPKSHYSDTSFASTIPAHPVGSSNGSFDDGNDRFHQFSGLGIQAEHFRNLASPRCEAPGTPSMLSAALDVHAPRAESRQTLTSVTTRNLDDIECPSLDISDVSSLSSADEEGSDAYPETEHYPMRVDLM